MIRPLYTWVLFGLCLAVATAAMGWVSWTALQLEAAQGQARRQELHEENVRLALWRMDSTLALLIAQESARPYFHYSAFYAAERAYNRMMEEIQPGEVRLPSKLLVFSSPQVLLHFQIGPDGAFTSPQVPQGDMRDLAEYRYVAPERIRASERELARLRQHLGRDVLLAALPAPQPAPAQQLPQPAPAPQVVRFFPQSQLASQPAQPARVAPNPPARQPTQPAPNWLPQQLTPMAVNRPAQQPAQPAPNQAAEQQEMDQQVGQGFQVATPPAQAQRLQQRSFQQQQAKNTKEYIKRQDQNTNIAQEWAAGNNVLNGVFNNDFFALQADIAAAVSEGPLRPMWLQDRLLLARRVSTDRGEYVQGCVLNWPVIRQLLLTDISDLLPKADLEPVHAPNGDRAVHLLAALPVRLAPGPTAEVPVSDALPVRTMLWIAWACLLLTAAAVGALLSGAMTLSERRGAFVSAVTHELRTPLTTLRMYTEMLAEGMVRDDGKKRSYLQTLRAEADRLAHLVENVLAYSRIERGRARGHVVNLPVKELVDRVRQRLGERAGQAGMRLVVEPAKGDGCIVRADPSAVEQILFNLVDNASKYAASAEDRSIHLDTGRHNGRAVIRVRDHGPGIGADDHRRLFRPFSKSAREAANSAPGVGLGLALSRRLAREMGGDLCLDGAIATGACFLLWLPLGASQE